MPTSYLFHFWSRTCVCVRCNKLLGEKEENKEQKSLILWQKQLNFLSVIQFYDKSSSLWCWQHLECSYLFGFAHVEMWSCEREKIVYNLDIFSLWEILIFYCNYKMPVFRLNERSGQQQVKKINEILKKNKKFKKNWKIKKNWKN